MRDLVIRPNSEDIVTITVAEQQTIIDANEEEDAIGVEQDLQVLFKSKYAGVVNVQFHIEHFTPLVIVFCSTSDPNWWV